MKEKNNREIVWQSNDDYSMREIVANDDDDDVVGKIIAMLTR